MRNLLVNFSLAIILAAFVIAFETSQAFRDFVFAITIVLVVVLNILAWGLAIATAFGKDPVDTPEPA